LFYRKWSIHTQGMQGCFQGERKGMKLCLESCSLRICGTHGLFTGRWPAGTLACASGAEREVIEVPQIWSLSLWGWWFNGWECPGTGCGKRRAWNLSVPDEYRLTHGLRRNPVIAMKQHHNPALPPGSSFSCVIISWMASEAKPATLSQS
jgi:hypothetical protein